MPYTFVPFGELTPDFGDYNNSGLSMAGNVVPILGGYCSASAPSIQTAEESTATPTGLHAHLKGNGDFRVFWGESDKIWQVDPSVWSRADRSRAAGYTGVGKWDFISYGPFTVANATSSSFPYAPAAVAIQRRDSENDANLFAKNNVIAAPVTADPRARFIATIKNHLVLGGFDLTTGTSGGEAYGGAYGALLAQPYPNGIWWSSTDDISRFSDPATTPAVIGSDYRLINDNNGSITGLLGGDNVLITKQKACYLLEGPPFQLRPLVDGVGTTFGRTLVRVGEKFYFWNENGMQSISNNGEFVPIGDRKVLRDLLERGVAINDAVSMYSAVSQDSRIIFTVMTDTSYISGEPDMLTPVVSLLVAYNIQEDRFSYIHVHEMPTGGGGRIHALTPYPIRAEAATWDSMRGLLAILEEPAGNTSDIYTFDRYQALAHKCKFATGYMRIPQDAIQTWRPKRIRPIYSWNRTDNNNQKPLNVSIQVYSRAKPYQRGETPIAFANGPERNGWYNIGSKNVPFSFYFKIRVDFSTYDVRVGPAELIGLAQLQEVFNFHGFELEWEAGGAQAR